VSNCATASTISDPPHKAGDSGDIQASAAETSRDGRNKASVGGKRRATSTNRNGRKSPRELLDAAPPHDDQAEAALLCSIIIDPKRLAQIQQAEHPVRVEDFFSPDYRRLFAAMLELEQSQAAIDPVLLKSRLISCGAFDDNSATVLLYRVMEAVAVAHNALHYAESVRTKAIQRRLGQFAERCLQLSRDDSLATHDLLGEVDGEYRLVSASGVHPAGDGVSYDWTTFDELQSDATEQAYLVEDVVTEGQGGLICGRFKSANCWSVWPPACRSLVSSMCPLPSRAP
jgi:hypothetical protein